MAPLPTLWRKATFRETPTEQLRAIRELRRTLDELELEAVLRLREMGMPWRRIAEVAGVSRQALERKRRRWGL